MMPQSKPHHFRLCLILVVFVASLTYGELRYHDPGMTGGDITVVSTSPTRNTTRLQFTNPVISREDVTVDGESFTDIWIDGESHTTESGYPSLPVVNRLIGIPDRGNVQLIVNSAEYTEETGLRIYPFQGMEEEPNPPFRYSQEFYNQNTWYPAEIATLGDPAVFRDVRIATVSICPIQINPATGTIRTYHNIDVSVVPAPGQGVNEKVRSFNRPSRLFMPMYRELANFQYLEMDEEPATPGTYLIICSDHPTPIGLAEQLAQWKRRKGIPTRIATRTETGSSYTQIIDYIRNTYYTLEPALEYVLLLGDDNGDPSDPFYIPCHIYLPPNHNYPTDHIYSTLEGDDCLADVAVGRLSAEDAATMELIVTKSIRYENDPYLDPAHNHWFTSGYLLAGTSYGITSSTHTMEYNRAKMYDTGFTQVVLHTHSGHVNVTNMHQQLEMGRSFFLSRPGYAHEMECWDIDELYNGWMLPFVIVITCYTGNFAGPYGTNLSECWIRYGSPLSGGGAVACVGTAGGGTHVRANNIITAGIGHGFFVLGTTQAGVALMEGKFQLYRNFPHDLNQMVPNQMHKHNLMGDPELKIWTAVPETLFVIHPSNIPLGSNRVAVQVTDANCDPVEGALVCLMKGEETWTRAYTDNTGYLEMPTNPETEGALWLTVTKTNHIPYLANIQVTQQALCLALDSAIVDDDSIGGTIGNNDGEVNPQEVIDITVVAHNYGTSTTATNVIGTLISYDTSLAQVVIDQQPFPNIIPGTSAQSQNPFRVAMSHRIQDQDRIPLLLQSTCLEGSDTSLVPLTAVSGDVYVDTCRFLLSNNRLDPGETEEMVISVANIGHHRITNPSGHLSSTDPHITFPDPVAMFDNIAIDSVGSNSADAFVVTADYAIIPGHSVRITLAMTGDDGFRDTAYFDITVGVPTVNDPTGPDDYGYYCFDNLDVGYENAPEYEWIEIDPTYGGHGEVLPLYDNGENEDDSVVRPLPFPFRMYNVDYDSITVCSNGWAALGNQAQFVNFRNFHIPGPQGPNAMLAAFWDELVMGSGCVCWAYVEAGATLIIQWSRVRTLFPYCLETFQIILYDPAIWETPSGDGMIKYQYHDVINPSGTGDVDYATVGIESHTQLVGLEITYWNSYALGAAPLEAGRAYLFTTLDTLSGITDSDQPIILDYALGQNYPNPFNPTTTIPYRLKISGEVSLTVYNILGQKVATLIEEYQEAGYHHATFDGGSLSSGIYFYRLEAASFVELHKMVLLK